MKLTRLTLQNFRRFERLEISMEGCSRILFVGNNGAGKSTILEAIADGLSWLVARIQRDKGNGSILDDGEILNGAAEATITLDMEHGQEAFQWSLIKTRKGRKKHRESQLTDATRLADQFRTALGRDGESTSLPLMAYYPVERVVLDVPLKIKTRHQFGQLDGYDNALQQGVDFRRFFEWFREREDSENESTTNIADYLFKVLEDADQTRVWEELKRLRLSTKDRQLTAVRSAIKAFMPDFANLRIKRRPRLQMVLEKEEQTLDVGQLSQGEKSLMALVGDVARRLAMMNPSLTNPLHGEGIVLIDEVDLHLHPRWQRTILGNLANTFPNVQFILTTHSPIIISQERHVCVFGLTDGDLQRAGLVYGLDVNQVLLQEMDTEIRATSVQEKIDNLLHAIQNGDAEQAQSLLADLESQLPANHLEVAKARLLLYRLHARKASLTAEIGDKV